MRMRAFSPLFKSTLSDMHTHAQDGTKKRLRPLLVTDGASVASLPSSRGPSSIHPPPPPPPPMGFVSKKARITSNEQQGGGGGGAVTVVMFEKEGGATLEIPCPYATGQQGALARIVTDFAGFGAGGGGGFEDDYLPGGGEEDEMMMGSGGAGGGGGGAPVVLDCQVEEAGAPGLGPWPMSRLRASRGGRLLWKEVVPGRAMTLCGNGTVVAVGCQVRRLILRAWLRACILCTDPLAHALIHQHTGWLHPPIRRRGLTAMPALGHGRRGRGPPRVHARPGSSA